MIVRRDTQAWIMQTWISFIVAIGLCAIAIWNMPSESLDRAFAAIGMFFVLSSTFTLSKTLRDNQEQKIDTQGWIFQVWIAFLVSVTLTGWGIYRMQIGDWQKWFVVASCLFLLSSAFTLAKTMRDKHEADLINDNSIKAE